MISREKVLEANIKLHTHLADTYKSNEPHYNKENVLRVEKNLKDLQKRTNGKILLDVGCGMGFIIDIAKKYFSNIQGIDITQAMLDKIDTRHEKGKIEVRIAEIEKMPFAHNSFDVCTAYAVIHHLHALKPAFKDIYRVLRPGGVFYTDTDPNYYFWEAFKGLKDSEKYSDFVRREIDAIQHKDDEMEKEFNVPKDVLLNAEVLKHVEGGFKAEIIKSLLNEVGFSDVEIHYEWFLGEAKIIHSKKDSHSADAFRRHLTGMLPLSKHLFKYISIVATK
jgi:ubiquinone/menaquinone biosynthesis C-methylase UbiE